MLRNYVRVAFRVLRRSPGYTAINVIGLSLGLACCLLMLLFVQQEWSHDRFHRNADSIYRLYRVEHRVRTPLKLSEGVMAPLGPVIAREVPGVAAVSRLSPTTVEAYSFSDAVVEVDIAYVDPAFLSMFDFGASEGDLGQAGVLLLTESAAKRLQASAGDPLRLIGAQAAGPLSIAKIIPDSPANSSIQFDALAAYADWPNYQEASQDWDSFATGTFVQLDATASAEQLESALGRILKARYGDVIAEMISQGWWEDREDTFSIRAQPLKAVHLSPEIDAYYLEVSNPVYSLVLLGIALVILLIACSNFTALAVGRSVTRMAEVGTRKALGASRGQIANQFWGEALLLSMVSTAVGVALVHLFLPVFNRLADTELALSLSPGQVLLVCLLPVVVGLAAGAYPAAILSGMRPSAVLSGGESGRRGKTFTRMVIAGQFTATIALIILAVVMYGQLNFLAERDLGFADEEVLVVPLAVQDQPRLGVFERLAAAVSSSPAIVNTAASSSAFGGSWSRTVLVQNEVNHIVYTNYVTPSFLQTMGMDLTAGRNLTHDNPTDAEQAVLVNEAFVRAMGWEDPLGQHLERWPEVQVVGVIRDFNNLSMHLEVQPMLLHMSPAISEPAYAMVRYRTGQTARALEDLERAWESVAPGSPFQVEFLDQRLASLYDAERRWQEITGYSALLAVLISCLGLFGAASMSVGSRRREIGIRKVFGASSQSLAILIGREFAVLVGVAFLIACPIAYLISDQWLSSFAYRWPVPPAVFVAAGILTLGLALLTVGSQALSAARTNPTDTLRTE